MGGSASKPKPPPPAPAPVRADSAEGEQASIAASRRQGLRKTIDPNSPLAPEPALGSLGKLGVGGLEGTMVNTQKQEGPVAGWGQLTWAQKKALSPNRQ